MGGIGSGRGYRWNSRSTIDGLKAIDINWFNRQGYLSAGWRSVYWWRNGEPAGNITVRTLDDHLVLEYRVRAGGGEWEDVTEPVRLTWTHCNYGGYRPWFVCPGVVSGVSCGRRVAKLYAGGTYFLCRRCYDLSYASRNESSWDRTTRKAQNIRRRLGGSASLIEAFPPKPKGMHWGTYHRLWQESERAQLCSLGMMEARLQSMMGRLGGSRALERRPIQRG